MFTQVATLTKLAVGRSTDNTLTVLLRIDHGGMACVDIGYADVSGQWVAQLGWAG